MGTRPPLESEEVVLKLRTLSQICLTGGILLWGIPPVAFGHGSEYVYAKLIVNEPPNHAVLELSLEYRDNPIVESREQARSILEHDLVVRSGQRQAHVGDLRTNWSDRSHFDVSAPVPVPSASESEEHQLLCVRIDLSPFAGEALRLSVVKGSEQAVVFWIHEPRESVPPKWKVLLAGDETPEIPLPELPDRKPHWLLYVIPVIALGLAWQLRRKFSPQTLVG